MILKGQNHFEFLKLNIYLAIRQIELRFCLEGEEGGGEMRGRFSHSTIRINSYSTHESEIVE